MQHASTGGHALHIARPDHRAIADIVLMLDCPIEHITHDFHVAVTVSTKAAPRCNTVFIDHPQGTELHMTRIMVVSKGKRMMAIKPAMIGMASVCCAAYFKHGYEFRRLSIWPIGFGSSGSLNRLGRSCRLHRLPDRLRPDRCGVDFDAVLRQGIAHRIGQRHRR